jgi:hypothetical protein
MNMSQPKPHQPNTTTHGSTTKLNDSHKEKIGHGREQRNQRKENTGTTSKRYRRKLGKHVAALTEPTSLT